MMSNKFQPTFSEKTHMGWSVLAVTNHIMKSSGAEREKFEFTLYLPHLPEMVFPNNVLKLVNQSSGHGLEFTALEALKLVDYQHESIHVANSSTWKEARADCEHIDKVVTPFDWTYTTDYRGSLVGNFKIEETKEEIDMERLKLKDPILFYADVALYEDELHDCGCSTISVKIRTMPTYFFILLRFYLRVDDVLVRVNDTRIFHEFGTNHILREFTKRQSKYGALEVPLAVIRDPNEIVQHLSVVYKVVEKLIMVD
ncbi:hypothetical protein HELRODRAFT_184876 [Helobdella robusta]|uniref:TIP41-like protein n=1 Tax=Helobdella robusta TaxID=6412 RepID=T1FM42_HELRO|nr:hypothetical protein HELRODRAFT_184876 [Helobdella robusta]ESO13141.1 hypothetical protein HELRODRAFT_184876 [Helobdella robusta]